MAHDLVKYEDIQIWNPCMKHLYAVVLSGVVAWASQGQIQSYNHVELLVVRPKVERPNPIPDSLYNTLKEVVV